MKTDEKFKLIFPDLMKTFFFIQGKADTYVCVKVLLTLSLSFPKTCNWSFTTKPICSKKQIQLNHPKVSQMTQNSSSNQPKTPMETLKIT